MSLKLTSAKYLISKISFHDVVDLYGMSVSQMTLGTGISKEIVVRI
jgi:hypothetical protein